MLLDIARLRRLELGCRKAVGGESLQSASEKLLQGSPMLFKRAIQS
jgi:hypothetical protein